MALQGPLSADLMEGYAVGKIVNRATHDGPDCVEPA